MNYGEMMKEARESANVSREYIADKMNTTYKTVWNWENGFIEPRIGQFFDFFTVCGVNVMTYLNHYMNNDDMDGYEDMSEKQVTSELHAEIDTYTYRRKCLLHFILKGKHGANLDAQLNKEVAHLQSGMQARIIDNVLELSNYRLSKSNKQFPIIPNTKLMHIASLEASKAYIEGKEAYTIDHDKIYDASEAVDGMLDI